MFNNNTNFESLIPLLFATPFIYVIYYQNKIILLQKNKLLQTSFFKKSYLAEHDLVAYYYNLYKSSLKTNFYLQKKKSALSVIQEARISDFQNPVESLKYNSKFIHGIPLDVAEQKVQLLYQAHVYNIYKLRILQQQLKLGHLQCSSFSPEQLYGLVAPVVC
jgi:hypothetical protein